MNSKNYLVIAILCSVVLASCKKEEPIISEPDPIPEYAALKVGNYWVYETYFTNKDGKTVLTNDYDSAYIEKDTIINGQKFAKKVVASQLFSSTSFWREENGKLINNLGDELPTEAGVLGINTIKRGNDTIALQTSVLLPNETYESVPAGVFKVRTIEHRYKIFDNGSQTRIRNAYTKYHPTKGDVSRTYFFMFPQNGEFYQQVLVRTNVE